MTMCCIINVLHQSHTNNHTHTHAFYGGFKQTQVYRDMDIFMITQACFISVSCSSYLTVRLYIQLLLYHLKNIFYGNCHHIVNIVVAIMLYYPDIFKANIGTLNVTVFTDSYLNVISRYQLLQIMTTDFGIKQNVLKDNYYAVSSSYINYNNTSWLILDMKLSTI